MSDSSGTPATRPEIRRELVFISYSRKDREWLERLKVMLAPLTRRRMLSTWEDADIRPGQVWRSEIQSALRRASVAVLLVSPDFLASNFIAEHELPPLLEAARSEGLSIIWVPLRDSLFADTEIGQYQAAHDPAVPLDSLKRHEQERALVRICQLIRQAAELEA